MDYKKALESNKKLYKNGELNKDNYFAFLKGTIIEQTVSLKFEKDAVDTLDEMRRIIFELYYLIGSVVLDMDIDDFEFMSHTLDMMESMMSD